MARLLRSILIFFCLVIFAPLILAEEITITTYYPSPYGSYNELQLYPHTPAVATCNASNGIGTMFYDSSTSQIKVCQGALGWVVLGGGVSFTYYCFSNAAYGTPVCSDAGGTQGYCPAGYQQKAALGAWGYCHYVPGNGYQYSWLLPPGGACGSMGGVTSLAVGNAYVCSQ